jgi:small subunit ribosomal protein S21
LAEVRLQEGETVENALRRFKRQVVQEIIADVKRHSFYLKPGQKLRVNQALARKRNRKEGSSGARVDRRNTSPGSPRSADR